MKTLIESLIEILEKKNPNREQFSASEIYSVLHRKPMDNDIKEIWQKYVGHYPYKENKEMYFQHKYITQLLAQAIKRKNPKIGRIKDGKFYKYYIIKKP